MAELFYAAAFAKLEQLQGVLKGNLHLPLRPAKAVIGSLALNGKKAFIVPDADAHGVAAIMGDVTLPNGISLDGGSTETVVLYQKLSLCLCIHITSAILTYPCRLRCGFL